MEEITFEKVSPKYKAYQHVFTIITALIYVVVGTAVTWNQPEFLPYSAYITIGAIALWVSLRILAVHQAYKWKGYALRERDLIYRSGWLWRKIVVIPFARIQHGELSQGVLERQWNLKKIKIFTAGGSSSDLSIPALPAERADELRKFIMNRVSEEAEADE